MAMLGRVNRVRVVKEVDFGVYVDAGQLGEVLLPKRSVPANTQVDDELDVFIYRDSQDRLVASSQKPRLEVGGVACLKVTQVNRVGAFLDWGMPKDLFVPFAEQQRPMEVGKQYCVCAYIDQSGRIAASSKLSWHLQEKNQHFKSGQAVQLLVVKKSEMGYTAVIDGTHLGLIHQSDVLKPLRIGQQLNGYIKGIRPDLKINLRLQPPAAEQIELLMEQILTHLKENQGVSTVTDKSSPDEIFALYRASKASFKRAIGRLLKLKKVQVSAEEIRLL